MKVLKSQIFPSRKSSQNLHQPVRTIYQLYFFCFYSLGLKQMVFYHFHYCLFNNLQSKLGTTPVTTLSIVLDAIVRAKTNPLWQRTVLPLLLGKSALCTESFLGWLCHRIKRGTTEKKDVSYIIAFVKKEHVLIFQNKTIKQLITRPSSTTGNLLHVSKWDH